MTRKATMAAGVMLVAIANGLVTQRAIGISVVTAVSQENLDKQPFTFDMEVERYQKGKPAAFRIEIKPKKGRLSPFLSGKLTIRDEQGEIANVFLRGHRKGNIVRYTFLAAPRIVDRAEFTFFNEAHDGDTPEPGFDAYGIPLRLFLDRGKPTDGSPVPTGRTEATDRIPALIEDWKRGFEFARSTKESDAAREELLRLGPAAVPHLIEKLEDLDYTLNTVRMLGWIGPDAKEATAPLIRVLTGHQHPWVRAHAARALARIDPGSEEVVDALIKALNHQSPQVAKAAAVGLGEIGPSAGKAIPELTRVWESKRGNLRWEAGTALGRMGLADRVVPGLVEALTSPEAETGHDVARALGRIGPKAKAALPALVRALKDEEDYVRSAAELALGSMGPSVVPHLIEALRQKDVSTRIGASGALAHIGPAAKDATTPLIEGLKDANASVRFSAACTLRCIGPPAKAAVPALQKTQQDQDEQVRRAATEALRAIGPATTPAEETPRASLHDEMKEVRDAVADDAGKRNAAEELVEKMRGISMQSRPSRSDGKLDPVQERRDEIVRQLRGIGKEATVPALARTLRDPDVQMRRNAALVLIDLAGKWTEEPHIDIRAAMPALVTAMEDKDQDVRAWAAHAIAEVGPDAEKAIPDLRKMLSDPEPGPRHNAAMALAAIGPKASAAVGDLTRALTDRHADVRWRAAVALGRIGPAAKEAIPALTGAFKDKNERVRRAAAEAAQKVRQTAPAAPKSPGVSPDDEAGKGGAGEVPPAADIHQLVEQLKAPEEEVREAAVAKLAEIGKSAVGPLIHYLQEQEGENAGSCSAARSLGRIGDRSAVPALIEALKTPGWVGYYAAEALGEIGDPRAIEPLLNSMDIWGCTAVFVALAKFKEPRAVEPIIKRMEGGTHAVRFSAAHALGMLKDKRATEPLIRLLDDRFNDVRRRAVESLGEIGDPRAVEPLIGLFSHEAPGIPALAINALGRIGDKRAVDPLIALLKDDYLSQYAAESLGMIGDSKAVEPLIVYLKQEAKTTPKYGVGGAMYPASKALAALDYARASGVLEEMHLESEEPLRSEIQKVLRALRRDHKAADDNANDKTTADASPYDQEARRWRKVVGLRTGTARSGTIKLDEGKTQRKGRDEMPLEPQGQ